jgi:hypothetical protein
MEGPNLNTLTETPNGFEHCLEEMQEIEDKFNEMMQNLAINIGDEFKAYARLTSDICRCASELASEFGHARTAGAIAMGATILQKGLEVAGSIKSNSERNRMLDKLLNAKMEMARVHKMGIAHLLPRAERNEERFRKFALTMLNKNYELASYNNHSFELAEENCMKYLTLYRTSKFLVSMGHFVKAEIAAWENGCQTSNAERPTLFTVNLELLEELYDGDPLSAFDKAAHATNMTGTQIVMLRDEMFLPCVIESFNGMMGLDLSKCSVQAQKLLKENDSIRSYMKNVECFTNAEHSNPLLIWRIVAFTLFAIWCVFTWAFTQSEGTDTSKFLTVLLMLIGSGAIYKYYKDTATKIVVQYMEDISALADRLNAENLQRAGYQEFEKKNYAKKSSLRAAWDAL